MHFLAFVQKQEFSRGDGILLYIIYGAEKAPKSGGKHMPIVQVEILPRSQELKRELAKEVTNTIVNVLNCPADAVRVIIREMPPENYAMAGVLACDK